MNSEHLISRRVAIQAIAAGSSTLCNDVMAYGLSEGMIPQSSQVACPKIKILQCELAAFSLQIAPRFIDGRGMAPAYCRERRAKLSQMTLRLSRNLAELDASHPPESEQALEHWEYLRTELSMLWVDSSLRYYTAEPAVQAHPAMEYLRCRTFAPGYAFFSIAPQPPVELVEDEALKIAKRLNSHGNESNALKVIRDASDSELFHVFGQMEKEPYLRLIETLFLVRPSAPVALLKLHTGSHCQTKMFQLRMSHTCGNLMERLANNHFDQVLRISRLKECNGSWHPFIVGQVFDVLFQKWMSFAIAKGYPVPAVQLSPLPLAIEYGVPEPRPAREQIYRRLMAKRMKLNDRGNI